MTPARKEPDTTTYSGRFAKRLRAFREDAGLTAEEMAARITRFAGIAVDKFRLYKWESAKAGPPYDLLPAIAKALKLRSVKDLMPDR